uniref:Uncharacterized protein n=1 Tax=Schizaphis graminum TaxID=13262 RepID=A0A2S2NIJ5_SCHGA
MAAVDLYRIFIIIQNKTKKTTVYSYRSLVFKTKRIIILFLKKIIETPVRNYSLSKRQMLTVRAFTQLHRKQNLYRWRSPGSLLFGSCLRITVLQQYNITLFHILLQRYIIILKHRPITQ